jgi:hypothetical protein
MSISSNQELPLWKYTERIVAILEKAISPDARVEHNVQMKVIGSPSGRTRQCDVVITFGKPPRQTIAIVEVQKRKKKPDINTFHGWYHKMQEVGAQQLICVSALGYPLSIIEEVATKIGPTVKLLTLEDLAEDKTLYGCFLIPRLIVPNGKWKIHDFGTIDLIGAVNSFEFILDTNIKNFSVNNISERLSLNDIIRIFLNQKIIVPPPHELSTSSQHIKIVLDDSVHEFWFHHLDCKFRIKNWSIDLEIYYEPQEMPIPVTNLVYKQQSIDGVMAWVSIAQFVYEEQEHEINIIFKPDDNGFLQVMFPTVMEEG